MPDPVGPDGRHERLTRAFSALRALRSAAERQAWLAANVADIAERAELAALFAAHTSEAPPAPPSSGAPDFARLLTGVMEDAASEQRAMESLPRPFGAYTLERLIGTGGMGSVYAARQATPSRIVAVKILRPGGAGKGPHARFVREAEALALMKHPGIAQVYETGVADTEFGPRPYLAMEHVEGESITSYATKRGLDVQQKMALLERVCSAVAHAHGQGIVHRDIKPGNVLVQTDGSPKLIDFGIAQGTGAGARFTLTGQVLGTPGYLSPEQARGDAAATDVRTDVFALGLLAHELLTGTLPHGSADTPPHVFVKRVLDGELAPFPAPDRALRGDIVVLFRKALAHDPARRYQTAEALRQDIARYLAAEPILARPPSAAYQFARFVRRNKAVVIGAGAAMLALLVGSILATLFAIRADGERRRANDRTEEALLAEGRAVLQHAGNCVRTGRTRDAKRALDRIRPVDRGWPWRYLHAQLDQALLHLPADDRLRGPSPGQPMLPVVVLGADAVLRYGEPVEVRRRRWGEATLRSGGPQIRWETALEDSTGTFALIVADGGRSPKRPMFGPFQTERGEAIIRRVGRDAACVTSTGAVVQRYIAADDIRTVAASTVSNRVAVGGRSTRISVFDLTTGARLYSLEGHFGPISALAFDSAGERLLSGSRDGTLRVWNLLSGKADRLLLGHVGPIAQVAITPDGRHAVSVGSDGARVWDLAVQQDRIRLFANDPFPYVYDARFDGSGQRIAAGGWGSTVEILGVHPLAQLQAIPVAARVERLAWLPSGDALLFGGKRKIGRIDLQPPRVRVAPGRWNRVTLVGLDGDARAHVLSEGRWHTLRGTPEAWRPPAEEEGRGVLTMCFDEAGRAVRIEEGPVLVRAGPDSSPIALEAPNGRIQSPMAVVGRYVVAAIGSRLHVWDGRTGRTHVVLQAHEARIHDLAPVPGGQLLASCGDDGTIRFWDLARGEQLLELAGHDDYVRSIDFSPDGSMLCSASGDGTVRLWSTKRAGAAPETK